MRTNKEINVSISYKIAAKVRETFKETFFTNTIDDNTYLLQLFVYLLIAHAKYFGSFGLFLLRFRYFNWPSCDNAISKGTNETGQRGNSVPQYVQKHLFSWEVSNVKYF